MNERLQSFESLNERPIGRFLNSLDMLQGIDEYYDAFIETKDFITKHQDILHRRGVSFIARAMLDNDGHVSIPRDVPKYEQAVWLELDHSVNPYGKDERVIWRLSAGREQYNLELRENYWLCTYCEKDMQGSLLRRYPLHDDGAVAGMYDIVRTIIGHPQFEEDIRQIMLKKSEDMYEFEALTSKEPRSLRENKRIAALRSSLFNAGFAAGSIDRTQVTPLVHSLFLESDKNTGRLRESDV